MTSPSSGSWPEVRVSTTVEHAEDVEQWLFAAGALSITFLDDKDEAILEPAPGEVRLWEALKLVGLFAQGKSDDDVHAALLLAAAANDYPAPIYTVSQLQDTQWERTWMDTFMPMQFGDALWVCPSHMDVPEPDAVNIRLDPGLAFGSGTHATTAQCLRYLGNATSALCSVDGKRVVDFGCGSGILAVAAALLGAQQVYAVDIDPQAIEATRRNADANGVDGVITTGLPSILSDVSPCDLVLANILCEPLLHLASTFAELVRPNGVLVMSGVLVEQIDSIRLGYNEWFNFDQIESQDDWALLIASKRSNL